MRGGVKEVQASHYKIKKPQGWKHSTGNIVNNIVEYLYDIIYRYLHLSWWAFSKVYNSQITMLYTETSIICTLTIFQLTLFQLKLRVVALRKIFKSISLMKHKRNNKIEKFVNWMFSVVFKRQTNGWKEGQKETKKSEDG